jgi:hypothetical protein
MRHEPGFAAAIEFGDSSYQTIRTDSSWRALADLSFGARDQAWASIEEHIDARKGVNPYSDEFAMGEWPAAVPVGGPEFFPVWPRTTPHQSETPRDWSGNVLQFPIVLSKGQDLQFTLPEIVQGNHLLEFDAQEGSELETSYLLPEGEQCGSSTYIARAGLQTWLGGDTFAFNQLAIRLISGAVTLHAAKAIEVRYPFIRVGSFQCSDPMLTQLWQICARSLELLSEDAYVDCADRERVEWTDNTPPAFDCTRVMMRGPDANGATYWGDNRLLKALLRRIALTQQPDGQMKAHSCSERWDIHAIMEDRSCDWVIQLREYFESSQDVAFVKELWPNLTRLLHWFLDHRTERGLVQAREWEVWDNPLRYQVCEGAGLNALVFRALCDAAYLGKQVGEISRAVEFDLAARSLREEYNKLLWNSREGAYYSGLFGSGSKTAEQLNGKLFPGPIIDGRYKPTVQAELIAMYCGIVPRDRLAPLREWVLAHLDEINGIMTHHYLFDALSKIGAKEMDKEILTRIRTAWRDQVSSPWQTTWESQHGGSKIHIYGMVPGFWLTAYMLGARRVGPVSERTILVEPRCGDLQWAKGIAVTEFGPVEMDWRVTNDGEINLSCSCPTNCKTKLRLYGHGEERQIYVDGQHRLSRIDQSFVEIYLLPGRHKIQY